MSRSTDEETRPLLDNGNTNNFQHGSRSIQEAGRDTSDLWPRPVIQGQNNVYSVKVDTETKVYHRRWYIMFSFCLMNFAQNIVWNTWAPISTSAKEAFGWDDATIALQTNWGPIAFIVSAFFFAWLMDTKGLRWAVLSSALLVVAGAGLRCITVNPPHVTWLNHVGQILNGFAGPVAMSAQPLISATWFPPNQRTTATAIGTIVGGFGLAVSFIIGPLLVPVSTAHNATLQNSTANTTDINVLRHDILRLLYIEGAMAAAAFLCILVYFPSKPPMPPSLTSSIERLDFKDGFIKLLRHPKFWVLSGVYGLSSGIFNSWSSVINVNLSPLGVSQQTAGWLGFHGTVWGNVAAVFISAFADIFKRKMKLFLIALYSLGAIGFLLFSLVCIRVIPLNDAWLYSTMIAGSVAIVSGVPLFFELVCESTYPIAEGITNSLMTWLNNVAALAFYFVLMAPIGKAWMNWCMFGSVVICIPIFLIYKQRLGRYDIDVGEKRVISEISVNANEHVAQIIS